MARKDVELLVKANDQASGLLTKITDAINTFVDAEGDASKSTDKLGSTFGRVSKVLNDFSKAWQGATPGERIARDIERASKTTARYEGDITSLNQKLQQQQQATEKARTSIADLTQQVANLTAAQEREKAALQTARTARSDANKELNTASRTLTKLTTEQGNYGTLLDEQTKKVAESGARYERLQQQVAAAEKPTKRLVDQTEAAGRAYDTNQQKLEKLTAAQAAGIAKISQTEEAQKQFAAALNLATKSVDEQKAALTATSESLKGREQALRTATRSEKELGAAVKGTENDIKESAAALAQAQVNLTGLEDKGREAAVSMDQLAKTMRTGLVDGIRQQQSSLSQINNAYQQVSQSQAELSRIMSAAGVPTREMVEQQQKLATASREISNLHRAEKASLAAMRQELSATASDSSRLVGAQQQFAQSLQRSSAALGQAQATAQRAAAGNTQIASAAQRAAVETQKLGTAQGQQAGAAARAAGSSNSLAEAYKKIYGESRQAMSITQRLRGEVLSLATSYAGVYGAINILNQTVEATKTLEQAQVRLKAVFGTDTRAAQELDFVRRSANALALDFGVLSAEYSKFAAATKNTNLEGAATRSIFLSVAKAARVQALSVDEVQGVFKALTQISSKGKIQLEELSGQLGDRLPGALQIMADGLGVSTQELLKMTKEGQVTADQLEKFGQELEKRYGKFVPDAMQQTSAALQNVANVGFQALVRFGEGGFMEGFRKMLESIVKTLNDPAFESFADRVSVGFGFLAELLGKAVENFDLLSAAAAAFIGLRLGGVVAAIGSNVLTYARNQQAARAATIATTGALASQNATAGALAVTMGRVATAFRVLMSSTGIGLVLAAVSTGVALWATSADDATEAMSQHRTMVDHVRDAYDQAGGKVDEWAKKIKDYSKEQLAAHAALIKAQAATGREENRVRLSGTSTQSKEVVDLARKLKDLQDEYIANGGSVDEYKAKIRELANTMKEPFIQDYALELENAADKNRPLAKAVEEVAAAIKAQAGTATDADKAALGLATSTEEATKKTIDAAVAAEQFESALEKLKGNIPGLADELKKLKVLKEIEEDFNAAAGAARNWGDLAKAFDARQAAINGANYGGDVAQAVAKAETGIEAASTLLRKLENFQDTGKADMTYRDGKYVNSGFRAGYGSDTVTLSDGSTRAITEGMKVSRVEAELDLKRRLEFEFMPKVASAIGTDVFSQLNAQQQGVLASITYNYGSLPDRIVKAIQSGDEKTVADAIRALGSDNQGINAKRRNQEAYIYEGGGGLNDEESAKYAEKKAESIQKARDGQKEYMADLDREIAGQQQGLILREQNKAIAEREKELAKAGLTLSEAEKEQIREKIALKYKEQAAEEAKAAQAKTTQEAEAKVNQLLSHRRDLMDQIKILREDGDAAGVASAEEELKGVNTQLQAAIANAIQMWEAIGGTEAQASIASLRTAQLEAKKLGDAGKKSLIDWQQVGQFFASGLVRAFDSFAQKVAEGKSVGEAAKEAFMEFASQFLIDIGRMIVQQIVFNAVSGLMKSFGLPGLSMGRGGIFHGGGIAGQSGGRSRSVPMAAFAAAPRYHGGGFAGFAPNEVPAVLEREEEVLTTDDPRHAFNLGKGGGSDQGGGQPPVNLRNINVFDPADVMAAALSAEPGVRVLINAMRANKSEINGALG